MRAVTALVVVLLVLDGDMALGQCPPRARASVQLEADNDFFAIRFRGAPADYDYTHGTRVSVVRPTARRCLLSGVALGQEIYTPRHNVADPVVGERPYAAWLYGAVQVQRVAVTRVQVLELRFGVTGPPALGEPVQNSVHRLLNNRLETGWDHQLPTRLGIELDYDAMSLLTRPVLRVPSRVITGNVGATLGALRRTVRVGASAYYGFGTERSTSADAPLIARPGRFHFTAGYEQSLILHDAFVEGVEGTQGAVRLPLVGEAYAGAGWRSRRFAAEYRYVSRGREYRAETGRHAYGRISLSVLCH